jgi:hypothetical protein
MHLFSCTFHLCAVLLELFILLKGRLNYLLTPLTDMGRKLLYTGGITSQYLLTPLTDMGRKLLYTGGITSHYLCLQ